MDIFVKLNEILQTIPLSLFKLCSEFYHKNKIFAVFSARKGFTMLNMNNIMNGSMNEKDTLIQHLKLIPLNRDPNQDLDPRFAFSKSAYLINRVVKGFAFIKSNRKLPPQILKSAEIVNHEEYAVIFRQSGQTLMKHTDWNAFIIKAKQIRNSTGIANEDETYQWMLKYKIHPIIQQYLIGISITTQSLAMYDDEAINALIESIVNEMTISGGSNT